MENKITNEELQDYLLNEYLYVEKLNVPPNEASGPLTDEEFQKGIITLYLYGSKDPEETDWVIPPGNYSAIAKALKTSRHIVAKYVKDYYAELIELGFEIPNITKKYQKRNK